MEIRQYAPERTGLGGTVRRECISHDPEWVVYWHLPNGMRYHKTKIEMNNVSLSEAGKYTCVPMNRWDGQLVTVTFELDYQESELKRVKVMGGEEDEEEGEG